MIGRRHPSIDYGVAVLTIVAGATFLWLVRSEALVSTFLIAVIISAWVGGIGPGVLAIALSVAAFAYFLPPRESLAVEAEHIPRLLFFLSVASFIVWLIALERREAESLRSARDELQRQNEALRTENIDGKALENHLRRGQSELQLVIDSIPVIAWTARPDGSNEFTNRSWQKVTGLSATATSGAGWENAVHPEDIGRHVQKWQTSVETGTSFENEARYRGANGEYRWFLVRAVPLQDEKGNVLRWYGVLTDIEDRTRAEQALRESAGRLQHLSRRLLEVQEQERLHLARELHDEFAQLITGVSLRLSAAKAVAGNAAEANLQQSIDLLERAGERVRGLTLKLRPAMLEEAGLDRTLRWLADQQQRQTGILIQVTGELRDVAPDLATACFRVVQEALNNIIRHAGAKQAWIELDQDSDQLQLVVRDDGCGFEVSKALDGAATHGHFGLLGMGERVQILGGELDIDSEAQCGTRVRVSFPLRGARAVKRMDVS